MKLGLGLRTCPTKGVTCRGILLIMRAAFMRIQSCPELLSKMNTPFSFLALVGLPVCLPLADPHRTAPPPARLLPPSTRPRR